MEGFEQNKVGRWLELHHNMQLGSEGGRYCMALPPFLLSGSINRVRSKSAAWRWSINRVKRMARHFTKHPHEFNTFRLWAWERKPPISNTPEGLTSWKLGMSCERAGRLVVVESSEKSKNAGSQKYLSGSK